MTVIHTAKIILILTDGKIICFGQSLIDDEEDNCRVFLVEKGIDFNTQWLILKTSTKPSFSKNFICTKLLYRNKIITVLNNSMSTNKV